jgi:hypothetical protein
MELADPRASAVAATFFDKPEPQGFVPSGVWAKENKNDMRARMAACMGACKLMATDPG